MIHRNGVIKAAIVTTSALYVLMVCSCRKSPEAKAPQRPAIENLFAVQVNSFEETLTQIDKFLTGVFPVPMSLQMMVRMQLGQALGQAEPAGVDLNGSFGVFGVLLPDESGSAPPASRVFVAGFGSASDYEEFIGGNPNCGEPDANGVSILTIKPPRPAGPAEQPAAAASPAGPKILVARLGRYVLVTAESQYHKLIRYKKLMSGYGGEAAELAGIFDPDLSEQAGGQPIWTYGNVRTASEAFGSRVLDKLNAIQELVKEVQAAGDQMPMRPAVFSRIMGVYLGIVETLMKEVESVTLTAEPSSAVLRVGISVSAVPGTGAADLLAKGADADQANPLLGYLEDGAAANFAMKVEAPLWKELTSKSMDLMSAIVGPNTPAEQVEEYRALATESFDVLAGPIAGGFFVSPEPPLFTVKYVVAVKDAEKFNGVVARSAEVFIASGISQFYKDMGIEVEYTINPAAATYKGVTISSARLSMKAAEPNQPVGQMIETMYGGGFDYRWGLVNGLCVVAVGRDADSAVRELIDRVKADGPKQNCSEVAEALALLPGGEKADFFVTYNYVRVLKMATAWMQLGPMQPPGATMPKIDVATESNLVFAGRIGDGKIAVDVAVPKKHLAELSAAFTMMLQQTTAQMNVAKTRATLKLLESAVKHFKLDTGRYPTEQEGLAALIKAPAGVDGWDGPYIEGSYMLKDAWNRDFVYQLDPTGDGGFTIISYGADGKEGGEGLDADLRSSD